MLGLIRIASRTTWQMPWWEAAQILLGLAIPFLLFPHIVNTRIASTFFGVNDNYAYELARLWPARALLQYLLLLLVWAHGCIGVHYWLRLWEPYRRAAPVLLVIAAMLPIAALAGFVTSGRQIAQVVADPGGFDELKRLTAWPDAANDARLAAAARLVGWGIIAVLVALAGLLLRTFVQMQSRPRVEVAYAGGPTVTSPQGPTLLEISRAHGVPHSAICGGRGRCSTCRVRVDDGRDAPAAAGLRRSRGARLDPRPGRRPPRLPDASCRETHGDAAAAARRRRGPARRACRSGIRTASSACSR